MGNNNFKLCGGTLFSLLSNAKTSKRKSILDKKGYSEEELMLELVRIYNPSTYKGESFKKDTNNYKKCSIDDCGSFNFSNQELINVFDEEIRNNYSKKLNQMNELLNHFFETKSEPILNKLIRSVLELIESDTTISNDDIFYITPDGETTTKLEMLKRDTFNLSSFILGIYHYIVVNRINNELGKQTYEKWYISPGSNQRHTFVSDIGDKYKEINIIIDLSPNDIDTSETQKDEQETINDSIKSDEESKGENKNTGININNQIGHNNFGTIQNLIISTPNESNEQKVIKAGYIEEFSNQYYNLIVTNDAFLNEGCIIIKMPCSSSIKTEYGTELEVYKKFKKQSKELQREIRNFPTLVINKDALGSTVTKTYAIVCKIINMKYEYDNTVTFTLVKVTEKAYSQDFILANAPELDIKLSMGQTELDEVHWAIKEIDLKTVLNLEGGI